MLCEAFARWKLCLLLYGKALVKPSSCNWISQWNEFSIFFSLVCLSVNSFVQQWVKSNVICKCGWNKCKNFVFLLLDACKSKIICKRKSAEAGVQIAWRSCLRIFLRMLRVSFECRVCVVFQSTFELSFSHRHANTIVRISNGFLFFFPSRFALSSSFILSSYERKKNGWKVLNEQLQNEIEMWETINSFDKGKKKEIQSITNKREQ